MRAFLASKNPGKAREIEAILGPLGIEVLPPPDAWIAPEETGDTYQENALYKAQSLAEFTGEAAIADDSGIEVDALDGKPGVRSARYAGADATDEENLNKLIEAIKPVPRDQRTARYRCIAVLVRPGGEPVIAEGSVDGLLITEPRGGGGFGYDPIFVPGIETRTMSELSSDEKDAISHRGAAFRQLADLISG